MTAQSDHRVDWTNIARYEAKILPRAAALALVVEFLALTIFGWQTHWMVHPEETHAPVFIDAEVIQMPKQTHLTEEKPMAAPPKIREAVLSKVPNQGKKATEKPVEETNQTQAGPPLGPTHGPVAFFSPPPVIPPYLRDKELNTSAVIDFYISTQGVVSPRLVGSTGNEELDAIAIDSVKKWQFRPAEKDHHAVDSKVRLRIIFQVH